MAAAERGVAAANGMYWHERVNWEAITGITTALTAIAAIAAGAIALRVFFHDRDRAEAEQASQIAVWPVFKKYRNQTTLKWLTCITNTSQLPVSDWWMEYEIEIHQPADEAGIWTVQTRKNWIAATVLPPTSPPREIFIPKRLKVHLPKTELEP